MPRIPETVKLGTLLADLLSEEDKSHLLDLFATPENQSHSLTRSDLTVLIPTSPICAGKTSAEFVRIEPMYGKLEASLPRLLWESLFGRDFKVIHWNVLYRFIEKRKFSGDLCAGIFRILRLTSSLTPLNFKSSDGRIVRRNPSWETNIRPGRTVLTQALEELEAASMLKEILSFLPELPKKRLGNIDEFFTISTGKFRFKQPLPKRFVGVGYKDKGSIGSSHPVGMDEPDLGIWLQRPSNFARLSRESQKYADASEKYRKKLILSNSR